MNSRTLFKHSALVLFALTVAVGCGSAPTKDTGATEQAAATQATSSEAQQAIDAAKAKQQEAVANGAAWRDTDDMLKQAESLMNEGKYAEAIAMANKARDQADNALAQKQAEDAKMAAASSSYTVMRGDSLWAIAGKSDIYNNPYEWPLIYKANRAKIKDADLIFPGQVFSIDRSASQADIDAAVRHAKTRGAWSLGTVEESDLQYLGK